MQNVRRRQHSNHGGRDIRSRRQVLKHAASAGAAVMAAPLARLFGAAPAENVNILLLVCDALRPDRLGCYGYSRNLPGGGHGSTTPFVDSLAERGVVYENCISQASWTQTSMASMLYSAWPVIKGSEHSFGYVREGAPPLPSATPGMKGLAFQANPHLKETLFASMWGFHKYFPSDDYASAKVLNDEFDWVAADLARAGKPFVAYIHYMEPHGPYVHKHEFRGTLAPKDWRYRRPVFISRDLSRYHDDKGRLVEEIPADEMAPVLGMSHACDEDVIYMDRQIEALFGYLRRYNAVDRTFVILTADHGQAFGEHGWCGHKLTLYQEEIHIPLIIAGPGLPEGRRVAAQVRGVDVMPTIAALSGVSVGGLAGAPLLPAERVEAAGNREAYSCCDYARYGDVQRLLTCLVNRDRMKYIRILTKERELLAKELYDLNADPLERNDLLADRPDTAAEISARMDALEKKNYWHATGQPTVEIDEETRKQLESLGYLAE